MGDIMVITIHLLARSLYRESITHLIEKENIEIEILDKRKQSLR